MFAHRFKAAALAVAATLVTLTGTFAATGAPAYAGTATVAYRDLNLADPAGARALEQRIRHAAVRLCIDRREQPLEARAASRRCIANAITVALPKATAARERQREAQTAALARP